MTCRSLLVHLKDDRRGPVRVEFAVQLAKRLDAHLCGVAPVRWLDLSWPPMAATPKTMLEAAAQVWRGVADRKARLAQVFREACESARLRSFEVVDDEQDAEAALVKRSRLHDLTVLGQADPSEIDHALQQALVEQVVLHGGRPVLLLPCAGTFGAAFERVLIAWNGTRESARAVSDALPLLAAAQRVSLHCWNDSSPRAALDAGLDEVRRWLARHGVEAAVHVEGGAPAIEDALLPRAADMGADLIVMGAYGHTRWRERVLGGATRSVLRSMTAPVLMSH